MHKNPNVEKYGVTRSARIQVHRYNWGVKPNLKPEKAKTRRALRNKIRKLEKELRSYSQDIDLIETNLTNRCVDWFDLD